MLRVRTLVALALTGSLTLAAASAALLQEEGPKPTRHHDFLQKSVGRWEGKVTMTMPGMPEMTSEATEVVRSAGPFWTTSTFTSTVFGQPYEGNGCMGYDPEKGKFVSTWIDSMSWFMSHMEGEYDEATRTLVTTWDAPDMTGKITPHRSKSVMSEDGNSYDMTFWTGDLQTMTIQMTKVSSAAREASAGR